MALPEVVYHYTSVGAMMKIVESESVWATSICYLNDVSEQQHYLDHLKKALPAFSRQHQLNAEDREIIEGLNAPEEESFEARPFVASFSKFEDSLPQWRSYCSNGNGVAIGFNVNCLQGAYMTDINKTPLASPVLMFAEVEYVDTSKGTDLSDAFRARIEWAKRSAVTLNTTDVPSVFRYVTSIDACFRKHHSFSNEAEYRLVTDGVKHQNELLRFRPTRSTLVPYIEVNIPRSFMPVGSSPPASSARVQSFITRVVVGPTANPDLTCSAIRSFFRKRFLSVEVKPSGIPFREW